ncbi:MAG: cytochrome P450 [Deinococcales bacterium]
MINLRSPEFVEDPYPSYARLREQDPVCFVESLGAWLATRYEDVKLVLTDPRFGKQGAPPVNPLAQTIGDLPPSMLFLDPPDHTRLRALVNKAFTPRVVHDLRPRIEGISASLLDDAAGQGGMDVVQDFAFPLPAMVIAELLGVPTTDRERFKAWTVRVAQSLDGTQSEDVKREGVHAMQELADYFAALVARRRSHPRDDLVSALVGVEAAGERLGSGELLSMCVILLGAGHETTTNLIANGVLALLEHPRQMRIVREAPDRIEDAIEELLRYDSPVQRVLRVARAPVDLAGQGIDAGQIVFASIAAANRDPAVFEDPDRLDVTRHPNPHLAFSRGIHFCLGAPLARLEGAVAFSTLLQRFGRLQLDGAVERSPNTVLRGLRHLPVRI